ncbi:Opioid growth factor receptor (OGFr) conserved region containing protein, putative [Angomonas deanei]|uniref:Opioid growth factor receptor (OGFr) conserved region containing protein, putative n=1 Tax=Angomonas deanei TaxID=59799 RepID=A0A7G2C8R7_9TRYP|nr:Opioid growth factor receptor (OGFr) conserved region containing protein, putative [Angomonas deanei]
MSEPSLPENSSLQFYKGFRPISIDVGQNVEEKVFVISLHKLLMPPTATPTLDAEEQAESYAQQIAGDEGIELLRRNWKLIVAVLFPCGSPLKEASSSAATEGTPNEGAPISFEECASTNLRPADVRDLREPGSIDRIHYSYIVLLRFFGWRLHDESRGVLDRHRNWESRYTVLADYPPVHGEPSPSGLPSGVLEAIQLKNVPDSPSYGAFHFYNGAILRILQCFITVGFLTYAVQLVEFMLEEMGNGRLLHLYDWMEQCVLPLLVAEETIDKSHKTRLKKKFYKLTHSDSD